MEEIKYRDENELTGDPGRDDDSVYTAQELPDAEAPESSAPFIVRDTTEIGAVEAASDPAGDVSAADNEAPASEGEAAPSQEETAGETAVGGDTNEIPSAGDTTEIPSLGDTTKIPQSGDTKELSSAVSFAAPVDQDDEIPDVRTEISVEELEKKITASTVVTAHHPAPPVPPIDDDDDDDDDEPRRKRHPILITFILLMLLAAIVGGAYAVMAHHFETHFYTGTIINGRDVSGMTAREVKQLIADDVATYSLTITERDGVKEILDADDVKWAYVDDHKVDEIMANQDPWRWFLSISKSKKFDFTAGTTYDKKMAEAAIEALNCLKPENVTEPVDAYLTETPEGATITPEVVGNKVDEEKLKETVLAALDAGDTAVDITEPDLYLYPEVYSDDENLNRRMNDWNAYLNIEITYAFGDNVETVGRSTICEALKDDGENVTVDLDWIRPLVGTWADKYNTFGRERTFKTHSGETVTLPAYTKGTGEKDPDTKEELTHTSDYGWLLDSDATAADLQSAIVDRTSGSRQPIFKYSAKGWDNGDLTGSYVEVSIAEQHLWVYKDYQVVVETDVVTGAPVPDRTTYPGCYAIDAKKSPATLGTIATQGYSSEVNWWCPFDGGRGLHDAPWRETFGGQEYLANGSHGCVNCPANIMEQIYNNVSIGEAVIVY